MLEARRLAPRLQASRDTQPEEWSKSDFKEENNHSLVIRVQFGGSKFLFPGDMQDAAIESLVERYQGKPTLDVDVYQVSHHGAENGTIPARRDSKPSRRRLR